jgi:hypothetical protein
MSINLIRAGYFGGISAPLDVCTISSVIFPPVCWDVLSESFIGHDPMRTQNDYRPKLRRSFRAGNTRDTGNDLALGE